MLHPKIANGIRDVLMNAGFKNAFLKNRNGARMLLLHGIDGEGNTAYNSRFISTARFGSLLSYCKRHFHIASLEDFCMGNYPKDRLTITITFDDGLANNYCNSLPVLEKHQVPASFFITGIRKYRYDYLWPDFIDLLLHGKKEITLRNTWYRKNGRAVFISADGIALKAFLREQSFPVIDAMMKELIEEYHFDISRFPADYFLQMTEKEIAAMSNHPLATIGSHGMYHTDLTKITWEEAEQELQESKSYLEGITRKPINAFAFPFDTYSPELIAAAKEAGYKFILPYLLQQEENTPVQRLGINPYISLNNQLHAIYKGGYA